jgi:hypothetical protein
MHAASPGDSAAIDIQQDAAWGVFADRDAALNQLLAAGQGRIGPRFRAQKRADKTPSVRNKR